MPLKYPHEWKFGKFAYEIPDEAHRRFLELIEMMAEGEGDRWQIFEDFKSAFGNVGGSSNASWAWSDMDRAMESLKPNAARYVAAFWSGMEAVEKRGTGIPSVKVLNSILAENEVPLFIKPPNLLLNDQFTDPADETEEEFEQIPYQRPKVVSKPAPALSNKVFVVHGHDNEAKLEVADLLRKLKLEPIILHDELNKGRTIIEKFMDVASDVTFAVILLTPDDIGGSVSQKKPAVLVSRARQNVVFEMGFFYAALGRERVCALVKGDTEKPSDIAGVVYEPMDAGGGWKAKLAREMQGAKLPVDMNLL